MENVLSQLPSSRLQHISSLAGDGGPDLSPCHVYLFLHPCQAGSSFSKSPLLSTGHPMGDRLSIHAGLGAAEILLILAGLCGECSHISPHIPSSPVLVEHRILGCGMPECCCSSSFLGGLIVVAANLSGAHLEQHPWFRG